MRKITSTISFLLFAVFSFARTAVVPPFAKKLINTYKDLIIGYADNHILFKDGSKILWDDGIKNKTHEQLLDHPDLKDMFAQQYIKGRLKLPTLINDDPGRVRDEVFFTKIYGSSKKEVESHLTTITWCPKLVGQRIVVTKLNGVDQQLEKVSVELDEHPELRKYLTHIGGTFNWRAIKGTNRPSMHSFGITIDINTTYADYWQWVCKCTDEQTPINYRNRIPQLIVDTFEKYGFIWGGKWYHYDTMHFEYRPELL